MKSDQPQPGEVVVLPSEQPPPEAERTRTTPKKNRRSIWLYGGIILAALMIAVIAICSVVIPELKRREERKEMEEFFADLEPPLTTNPTALSKNITEPYASIEDARKDVEAMVMSMANTAILANANRKYNHHSNYHFGGPPMIEPAVMMDGPMAATMNGPIASKSESSGADSFVASGSQSSSSSSSFEGVDSFETYQQEMGAVRNDLIKTNGEFVFAANNDQILVWDLEGNQKESVFPVEDGFVAGLLLNPEGTKLIVISGLSYMEMLPRRPEGFGIFQNNQETKVTVYNIHDDGSLTKQSESTLNGDYLDAFLMDTSVHIVTKKSLDSWHHIEDPLSYWSVTQNRDLTAEEYILEASLKAEDLIPDVVDQIMDMIVDGDEILISPITSFHHSWGPQAYLVELVSFEIDGNDDLSLKKSTSSAIRQGYPSHVYASGEWIWVSDVFWNDHQEATGLAGFRLNGGSSTTYAAFGYLQGTLLSSFSIDFFQDDKTSKEYIRVATTQQTNNWDWRNWNPDDSSSSRTKNEVIILEVPNNDQEINELVRLGSIEVGKKHELITAVRFFDNLSYVVTFERTDPFYVLDLSDPQDPKVLGELEIPGFSEFMHPIQSDNSMLITLGNDADENGRVTGFQISIFDSSTPTDPKLVNRLVFDQEQEGWTDSTASWEPRAFRYLQEDNLGRLIIPLSKYSYWSNPDRNKGPFEGFMVFGINVTDTDNMISHLYEIDHFTDDNNNYDRCYDNTRLPERSMVFDSKLMTMRGKTVISTDFLTGERIWSLDFTGSSLYCYRF